MTASQWTSNTVHGKIFTPNIVEMYAVTYHFLNSRRGL